MEQQTAVDWLVEEIEKHYIINNGSLNPTIVMELKRQAKQMEKEQIAKSWHDGNILGRNGWISEDYSTGDRYYKKTYQK